MRSMKLVVVLVLVALGGALVIQMVIPSVAHAATSYTWTGNAFDGQWTSAGNWSPNGVPGPGDSATIGLPESVNLPTSTSVQNLTISGQGAELNNGSLTVTGNFNWTNYGAVTANIDIPSGATANISNPSIYRQTFEASSFSIEGSATISSNQLVLGQTVLTNTGTVTLEPGSAISAFACCVNPAQFINKGNVIVPSSSSGSPSALINAVSFNDSSTVNIGSNSTLDLQVAPSTFAAGVSFSGGGTLLLDYSANIQLSGTVNLGSGTTFQIGSPGSTGTSLLSGTGTLTGTGSNFSWVNGTLNGAFTIASSVTTTISGTDQKLLQSPGGNGSTMLALAGPSTLAGGSTLTLSGTGVTLTNTNTFTAQPGSTITAQACCVSPAQFVNQGSFVVPASSSGTQSAIINAVGFNDKGTTSIGSNSILDLQVAPSTFASGVTFNGAGKLQIDNNANIQLSGTVNLGSGTTFQVGSPGSSGNLSGTGTLTGTGSTFSWLDGTLNGTFTVASSVHTNISGGDQKLLQSPGGNGTTTLTLAGTTTLSGTQLVLSGGGAVLNNTGTFTPQAGSTITAQSCCASAAQFNNKGKLVVSVGAGNTFSISSVAFNNSGTVTLNSGTMQFGDPGYTQTAGSTMLNGGALTSTTSAILNLKGGKLTGKGTITASVQNAALIDPGTTTPGEGLLKIVGNYTQTSTGTLRVDIKGTTPGVTYDQLSVSGTATLNGTLDIRTASGFTPTTTDQFIVVTAKALTGTFTTLLNYKISLHLQYYAQYTTTTATLKVKKV